MSIKNQKNWLILTILAVFIGILTTNLFRIWPYLNIVLNNDHKVLLDVVPEMEVLDVSPEDAMPSQDDVVSTGFGVLKLPFNPNSIFLKGKKIVIEGSEKTIVVEFPLKYGYDQYKQRTTSEASVPDQEHLELNKNGDLEMSRKWRTPEEWAEIEADPHKLQTMMLYADQPYKWYKQILNTTPYSLFKIMLTSRSEIERQIYLISEKLSLLDGLNDFQLFECGDFRGYYFRHIGPELEEGAVGSSYTKGHLWHIKDKYELSIVLLGKSQKTAIEDMCKIIGSFVFKPEICNDTKKLNMAILEDLSNYAYFALSMNELRDFLLQDYDITIIKKAFESVKGKDELDSIDETYGLSLLHIAVLKKNREFVDYLLKKGADINGHTELNLTPLHFATLTNNLNIFKFLLENGANIEAKDIYGFTAYNLATSEIKDYMIEHGLAKTQSNKKENIDFVTAQKNAKEKLREKGQLLSNYPMRFSRFNEEQSYYVFLYYSDFEIRSNFLENKFGISSQYFYPSSIWLRVDV